MPSPTFDRLFKNNLVPSAPLFLPQKKNTHIKAKSSRVSARIECPRYLILEVSQSFAPGLSS